MKIITNNDKCTGCKVCVYVCPQKILKVVDKKMQVIDESRCMGCFGCEDECKEGAVRLLRAPQDVTDVVVEPPPENVTACDVAIVGAGPSGLGTAITCARAGLDVVVFDRPPNRKLCHHTDGGVLFSFPGQTAVVVDGTTVSFPELDISIEASFARQCDHLGLLGPDGLHTQSGFPKGLSGWAGNKDGLVEALVNEAQSSGARL
jgi:NAD-dependent dihydropyrimidine dehydrogenase PreA subunit